MKDIPGYEGIYAITKDGKIWNHPREETGLHGNKYNNRKTKCIYKKGGYFLKGTIKSTPPYPTVGLTKNGICKYVRIHRLLAITFLPNPQNLPCINHKNGIKTDNRLANLEWCTVAQNNKHAHDNGLIPPKEGLKGMKNHKALVTDKQVIEMRKLRTKGMTLKILGTKYGISFRTVWDIVTYRHWKHLP